MKLHLTRCFNSGLWVIHCQPVTNGSNRLYPHPSIVEPVWSKHSCTKLLTDRVTVLSTLRWLCATVIFVILLWWIDVCFCLLDGDHFFPDGSELASAFLCLHPLLCCNDSIFLWLEEPNQCPGWQRWFFDRMSLCDLLQRSETLLRTSPPLQNPLYCLNLLFLDLLIKSNLCLCSFCPSVWFHDHSAISLWIAFTLHNFAPVRRWYPTLDQTQWRRDMPPISFFSLDKFISSL